MMDVIKRYARQPSTWRGLALLLQGIGWFDSFDTGAVDDLIAQVRARLE